MLKIEAPEKSPVIQKEDIIQRYIQNLPIYLPAGRTNSAGLKEAFRRSNLISIEGLGVLKTEFAAQCIELYLQTMLSGSTVLRIQNWIPSLIPVVIQIFSKENQKQSWQNTVDLQTLVKGTSGSSFLDNFQDVMDDSL